MPTKTIGILGGGQLARMLVDSAQKLGLPYRVYAQSDSDSVSRVARAKMDIGSLSDPNLLRKFFQTVNVVTTENEFVDVDLLASAAQGTDVSFFPSLGSIKVTQDKLAQKKLFQELQAPTSRFLVWNERESSADFCNSVLGTFPQGAMLKWSRFGYDGKGNFPLKPGGPLSEAEQFLKEGLSKKAQIYAEEWVHFERELALLTAISENGDLQHFPMAVTEQRDSICYKVRGPAQLFGVSSDVVSEAEAIAKRIGKQLPFTGCFAIEFFHSKEAGLIVNELAPRVHNTGHHTQLSSSANQFDMHLLSILGRPLPSLKSEPTFGMVNVLGRWPQHPRPTSKQIQVYDYNKTPRDRRKLGHVNVIAETPQGLEKNLNLVESWIQ